MRSYIDLGVGVVSIDKVGSTSGGDTDVTPPLELMPDLSGFSAVDLEVRILSLSIADLSAGETVRLHLETSMQNTEDASVFWARVSEVEDGLPLEDLTAPAVFSLSISHGLLRYLRWRVSIPGHASAPAVAVKLVLQLRGFGRPG